MTQIEPGVIDRLVRGSIDMHVHFGPDPGEERRMDALQLALQARDFGMRGVVLKCHECPTAQLAYTVGRMVPEVTVIGSITLDEEVGGLNPSAVEASARMGAKVVWMPTFASANDRKRQGLKGGITIFDQGGKVLPVVDEILAIIREYDIVLATGHLSAEETFALVDKAKGAGLQRIVITHPLAPTIGASLSVEQQRELAEKGAYIEHCFFGCLPYQRYYEPEDIVNAVKTLGAERCILSTDLGQAANPAPPEGMRMMVALMLIRGLKEKEIEVMVKTNPARLLGLD